MGLFAVKLFTVAKYRAASKRIVLPCMVTVDPFRFGRRILSLISASGMAITMIGLGIYIEVGDGNSDLSWLPLLLILVHSKCQTQSEGLLSQRSARYKYNTREIHSW